MDDKLFMKALRSTRAMPALRDSIPGMNSDIFHEVVIGKTPDGMEIRRAKPIWHRRGRYEDHGGSRK